MNINGKKVIAILSILLAGFIVGDTAYYFYLKSAKPTDPDKLLGKIKTYRTVKGHPFDDEESVNSRQERMIIRLAKSHKRVIAARMKKVLYVEVLVLIVAGLAGGGIVAWGKRKRKVR